jgi:hypothetical protein
MLDSSIAPKLNERHMNIPLCNLTLYLASNFSKGVLNISLSTLTDPDLRPLEDGQENAADRSQTPGLANSSPSKKRLRRPWLRLSKSALNEILKHSQSNDIFIAHAKLKHLRGKNRLSSVGWVACIAYITLPTI